MGLDFSEDEFDLHEALNNYIGVLFTAEEVSGVDNKGNPILAPLYRVKMPNYDETSQGNQDANLAWIQVSTRYSGGNTDPLTTDEVNLKELVVSENSLSVEDLTNLEAYCAAKGYIF